MTLRNGEQVYTLSGNCYTIAESFAEGGQGKLYTEDTGRYLIKVYKTQTEEETHRLIRKFSHLQRTELPDNFIKIIDIIDRPCVGFIMEKLDEGFVQLSEFLQNNTNSSYNLRQRLVKASIIAKAFRQLHYRNLAYCDISPFNIMVKETQKGVAIKMIDIDNIYVPGLGKAGVVGTERYMAPEVRDGTFSPDILSDDFSLGVIIFEILRMGHPYVPYEAKQLSPEEEDEIAKTARMGYVGDDDPALVPANEVFTSKLKALTDRCFELSQGWKNRSKRPSSEEWEQALIEASNQVICCPKCGEYTYAFGKKKVVTCFNSNCGEIIQREYVLRFYIEITKEILGQKEISYYPTGKEFVLRTSLTSQGKKEGNYIKNFYLCDLQKFPDRKENVTGKSYLELMDEMVKENENTIEKSYLALIGVLNENQGYDWYYHLGENPLSCKYEMNGAEPYQLEKQCNCYKKLKNFRAGGMFRFGESKSYPIEDNNEGKRYIWQLVAHVEE